MKFSFRPKFLLKITTMLKINFENQNYENLKIATKFQNMFWKNWNWMNHICECLSFTLSTSWEVKLLTQHFWLVHVNRCFQNCFTNFMYRIRSDLRTMNYYIGEIPLDRMELQSDSQCRDWPYEHPQFVKEYIAKHPT